MSGEFRIASELEREQQDWGDYHWLSHPPSTGAKQLTVFEANLKPGKGHSFHKHPDQEEVLYVVSGEIEQWIDREKRVLRSGDAAFISADIVHASFNAGQGDAKLLVIFGPCAGELGFVPVDVSGEAPWKDIRA